MTRVSLKLCLLLLTVLTASACGRAEDQQAGHYGSGEPRFEERRSEFFVFGTVLEVVVWTDSETRAHEAFAKLGEAFRVMHRDWHAWEPGKLTDINEAFASGRAVTADPSLIELTRLSQDMELRSDGHFNAAVGALVELWGFHSSEFPIEGPPPSPQRIAARLQSRPSSMDIRIEGQVLQSSNPAVQLDFGGIAKGYAIDRACALLEENGIGDAIVNAGGDLRTMGGHGERPWRIAVRNPSGGVIAALETQGEEAVFTSGNYERFRQNAGRRYPHILDPRTGWPVEGLASVTVIAENGAFADASATALIVAGPARWLAMARSLGLEEVLVVDDAGAVQMTARMAARVQLAEGVEGRLAD